MKAKIIYFVFAVVILGVLGIYIFSNSDTKEITKEDTEYPALPVNELFVPIHSDTLDLYLKQYFGRGNLTTDIKRNEFVIEYNPNAYILLHANSNKLKETRKMLETANLEDFSVKYTKDKVRITMRKDGDYVTCPALFVAEILRKMNEQ